MKTTVLQNVGEILYCIAEVEQGKKYRITGVPNKRIKFSYAITDDQHSDILFVGTRISKAGAYLSFKHTIVAEKTGHLCIQNDLTNAWHWTEMTVSVEEVND